MRMTVQDIVRATQGTYVAPCDTDEAAVYDASVIDIVWDSRAVTPGCAYVALVGERVDGHRFVAAAFDAGAVLALVTHDVDELAQQAALAHGAAIVLVDDPEEALSRIARAWRESLSGTVVGLTGSTGKTTTKNLVRDVLAAHGSVVATAGNQNNEIGVPKTILNAQADTDAVVVEMGMRGLHQIESLCAFVKPDFGLITNVGESHIELLGSRENIARAKMELFEALPDNRGYAFINASDDYASFLLDEAHLRERGITPVFFEGFGKRQLVERRGTVKSGDAFVWAENIAFDEQGCPSFDLCADQVPVAAEPSQTVSGAVRCTLQLRGAHNVSNACSAAAVGMVLGMTLPQCASALAAAEPEQGRQHVVTTEGAGTVPAGITVVDDSYNANPDSMRASLAMFAAMSVAGKRVAVLGDMGELGDFAPAGHRGVGAFAAHADIDTLICVGELAHFIEEAALGAGMPSERVMHALGVDEALSLIGSIVEPGDAVLVKASHFMEFDQIVKGLVG